MSEPVRTGDDVVDAAVSRLDGLPVEASLEDQVRVLGEVHEALQQRLAATQA